MRIPRLDKSYRNLRRYRQIVGVLVKYGFAEVVHRMNLVPYLQMGRRIIRKEPSETFELSAAARLRLALEELGPTFIKLGQVLSTRSVLIPAEFAEELAQLQDRVTPLPFEQIRPTVEEELGGSLSEKFQWFDEHAIASASLAQVHRAHTLDGREVVVKVQRPEIERLIRTDMDILLDFAQLLERHIPESHQFNPEGLVHELARSILRELNFTYEGQHIERFARNFADHDEVYVPTVFWDLTTRRVLTTEYVDGIKISESEALRQAGLDLKKVAQVGAKFILKQIFEDGFFHADPHPGNLFIRPGPVIVPVDFGMMGRLDAELMDELSDLLIGVIRKDIELIIRVLVELGSFPADQDSRPLRLEISEFLDRYYGLPLRQLDLKTILSEVWDVVRRFQLRVPPNLMLLMKTLGTYDDLGRKLDPDFDLLGVTRPYVRRLLVRRLDPGVLAYESMKTLRDTYKLLRVLPREMELLVRKFRRGQMGVELRHVGLERLIQEIDRTSNRIAFSLIIAALIVGSSLILSLETGPVFLGYPLFGLLGFLFAAILGIWLVIAILRSGRL
jgi:ubiquinone biosynthesis protein